MEIADSAYSGSLESCMTPLRLHYTGLHSNLQSPCYQYLQFVTVMTIGCDVLYKGHLCNGSPPIPLR